MKSCHLCISLLVMPLGSVAVTVAVKPNPVILKVDWAPLFNRVAGEYTSGCKQFPSAAPVKEGISIGTDGRFSAAGIAGDLKKGTLLLSRIRGADGLMMFSLMSEEKDVLLVLETNTDGRNDVRLSKRGEGIVCPVTANLAQVNQGSLYANFANSLKVKQRLACMDIFSRKETAPLNYEIKNDTLKVFKVTYELDKFEEEVIAISDGGKQFNFKGFRRDGGELGIGSSNLSPFNVISKRKDESGYFC